MLKLPYKGTASGRKVLVYPSGAARLSPDAAVPGVAGQLTWRRMPFAKGPKSHSLFPMRVLVTAVQRIAYATDATYGCRRMMHDFQAGGHAVGRYRIRTLMRTAQVTMNRQESGRRPPRVSMPIPSRPITWRTSSWWLHPISLAGDITYLWTQAGWLYRGGGGGSVFPEGGGLGPGGGVGQCAGGKGPDDGDRPAAARAGPPAPFESGEPICRPRLSSLVTCS